MLTMGSLFDGIGGFPLAAVRARIKPLWASEIEAFPIRVTQHHFPDMLHVGDITKLDGAKLPPVDIICGGSPCQDLSVAGAKSQLLDHVDLVQGLTYTPENVKPYGTLVLRSSNIQNGRLSLNDNVYVNVHVPEEKMVQPGDILVCVRNGSSALIGKSCVLPKLNHTTFGAFMSVLRGDATGYFAKVFESNIVQEQVRGRSNATINQITKKDFHSIMVTVPSEPEQEEIARTLSYIRYLH